MKPYVSMEIATHVMLLCKDSGPLPIGTVFVLAEIFGCTVQTAANEMTLLQDHGLIDTVDANGDPAPVATALDIVLTPLGLHHVERCEPDKATKADKANDKVEQVGEDFLKGWDKTANNN